MSLHGYWGTFDVCKISQDGARGAAAARHSQSASVHTDSPAKNTFSHIFLSSAGFFERKPN